MKRPRPILRTLLNAVTILSLLLFVATCVLWVPSYWVGFVLSRHQEGAATYLALTRGGFVYATSTPDRRHPHQQRMNLPWRLGTQDYSHGVTWRHSRGLLGFGADEHRESMSDGPGPGATVIWYDQWRRCWVPAWAVCLLTSALPLHASKGRLQALWRRWRNPPVGHCPACGYDLRATPERCPECGNRPS